MALKFKIQLNNVTKPPIWRQVLVPENFTFHDLHQIIQIAFGWENCHLYQFCPKGYGSNPVIAIPLKEDWEQPDMDAGRVELSKIFTVEKQTFTYIYDFGDDWIHHLTLEEILPEKILFPVCEEGKGTCPPEDCGGPWGYKNMKEILANPSHAQFKEMKEWIGLETEEELNLNFFDKVGINKKLQKIFGKAIK